MTCSLTACTPGSAPGPTLGNEYGKLLADDQSGSWTCEVVAGVKALQPSRSVSVKTASLHSAHEDTASLGLVSLQTVLRAPTGKRFRDSLLPSPVQTFCVRFQLQL